MFSNKCIQLLNAVIYSNSEVKRTVLVTALCSAPALACYSESKLLPMGTADLDNRTIPASTICNLANLCYVCGKFSTRQKSKWINASNWILNLERKKTGAILCSLLLKVLYYKIQLNFIWLNSLYGPGSSSSKSLDNRLNDPGSIPGGGGGGNLSSLLRVQTGPREAAYCKMRTRVNIVECRHPTSS